MLEEIKGHDENVSKIIATSSNMLVPWFLLCSYMYYIKDISYISDELYDHICKRLLNEWDSIEHMHKHLIQKESLGAGTGFYLKDEEYPGMVRAAAQQLIDLSFGTQAV